MNEKIDQEPNGQPASQPQKPTITTSRNAIAPRPTPPNRTIDPHAHFCLLLGIDHPANKHNHGQNNPNPTTTNDNGTSNGPVLSAAASAPKLPPLYPRLRKHYASQRYEYTFTAALSNSLLLLQILIGAVVTALSATNTDHVVVTVFGAANTVIAGMIAYFKSRGQPMRSRAFRDELEAVVDAVEDAETRVWGLMKEQGWVSAHHEAQGQHNTLSPEAMKAGGGDIALNLSGSIQHGEMHGVAEPEGVTEGQMTPEEWRAFIRDEIDRLATMYDEACDTARRNYPVSFIFLLLHSRFWWDWLGRYKLFARERKIMDQKVRERHLRDSQKRNRGFNSLYASVQQLVCSSLPSYPPISRC